MMRDRASVRATGDVVSVRSEVPTTSSTMRATKNRPVARPALSTPTGPTRNGGQGGCHRRALATSVNASSSATARRPRNAMRGGTPDSAIANGDGTRRDREPHRILNAEQHDACTRPRFPAWRAGRCGGSGESPGTNCPNGTGTAISATPRHRARLVGENRRVESERRRGRARAPARASGTAARRAR